MFKGRTGQLPPSVLTPIVTFVGVAMLLLSDHNVLFVSTQSSKGGKDTFG